MATVGGKKGTVPNKGTQAAAPQHQRQPCGSEAAGPRWQGAKPLRQRQHTRAERGPPLRFPQVAAGTQAASGLAPVAERARTSGRAARRRRRSGPDTHRERQERWGGTTKGSETARGLAPRGATLPRPAPERKGLRGYSTGASKSPGMRSSETLEMDMSLRKLCQRASSGLPAGARRRASAAARRTKTTNRRNSCAASCGVQATPWCTTRGEKRTCLGKAAAAAVLGEDISSSTSGQRWGRVQGGLPGCLALSREAPEQQLRAARSCTTLGYTGLHFSPCWGQRAFRARSAS